ncbi:hypothetical protein M231_03238 [Tremella mesenterica]|uniref:Uncharacterized protein n=1 Tax=Tremella mesenterica TaxID=5217 RepID=A0A4Q1BNX6_TREME|nr:hypothetical protein M231_03238 [Tremella mesenterica]
MDIDTNPQAPPSPPNEPDSAFATHPPDQQGQYNHSSPPDFGIDMTQRPPQESADQQDNNSSPPVFDIDATQAPLPTQHTPPSPQQGQRHSTSPPSRPDDTRTSSTTSGPKVQTSAELLAFIDYPSDTDEEDGGGVVRTTVGGAKRLVRRVGGSSGRLENAGDPYGLETPMPKQDRGSEKHPSTENDPAMGHGSNNDSPQIRTTKAAQPFKPPTVQKPVQTPKWKTMDDRPSEEGRHVNTTHSTGPITGILPSHKHPREVEKTTDAQCPPFKKVENHLTLPKRVKLAERTQAQLQAAQHWASNPLPSAPTPIISVDRQVAQPSNIQQGGKERPRQIVIPQPLYRSNERQKITKEPPTSKLAQSSRDMPYPRSRTSTQAQSREDQRSFHPTPVIQQKRSEFVQHYNYDQIDQTIERQQRIPQSSMYRRDQQQNFTEEAQDREMKHVSQERSRRVTLRTSSEEQAQEMGTEDVHGEDHTVVDTEPEGEPFDPMGPIMYFDTNVELVQKWETLQRGMVPALQEFARDALSLNFEAIFTVLHVFHKMNEASRSELEAGVTSIEVEVRKHEEAKKTITDFSNELRRVAGVLRGFGDGLPR